MCPGVVAKWTSKWTAFPAFYQTSYNNVPYIFDHWARFLEIRCYIPQGALGLQDYVVLQRPEKDEVEAKSAALPKPHSVRRLIRKALGLRQPKK